MVERYRPRAPLRGVVPEPKSRYVGKASIKDATIKRAQKANDQLKKRIDSQKKTGDAFQNFGLNIGLGTNNALSQSQYGFSPITRIRTLLEWIHRGAWLGGIAIDLLAEDMTRGGVEILTIDDPKKVEKMQQGLTKLQIWTKLCSNVKWSNLYGGSLAVLLLDGQDPSTPLRIDRTAKGQFKGLMVLDRWMVEPDLNNCVEEYGPHLGLPAYYKVISDAPAMRGKKIHYSRCVRMIGIELPHWQAVMEQLWGLSIFERLYDRMIAFDSATMGAAQLVYKSYLRTYKIDGLHEAATTAGDALIGIANRVELMRKFQGIEGITLLDKEDDFTAHETSSVTGIADVLVHFAEQLSGSLQIPLVRLLGQSPAGLNSTGESDLRTYYDNILQRQERTMREGVNTILRVLAMSLGIKLDEEFSFNFNPLWQLNETEKSEVSDKDTRAVLETEAAGLISPKTALQELRQGSKVTGRWTNITNDMIEEASDEVTPPEAMMGMEEGEGGEPGEAPAGPSEGEASEKPEEGQGEASAKGGAKPKGAQREDPDKELAGLQRLKKIKAALGGGGDRAARFGTRALDAFALPFTEIGGFQIVVEFYPGTIRKGPGWSTVLPCSYGYLRRVGSAEGPEEWLDVLAGPRTSSRDVWVVDAITPEGKFDEHKVCMAFGTQREAVNSFQQMYGTSRGIGAITHMQMDSSEFRDWISAGDKNVPLAYDAEARQELRAVA